MKICRVGENVVGRKSYFDLYDKNYNIMLKANSVITERVYDRLLNLGFDTIGLHDNTESDVEFMLDNKIALKMHVELEKIFLETQMDILKKKDKIRINTDGVYDIVNLFLDNVRNNVDNNIISVNTFSKTNNVQMLVDHSICVMINSYLIGRKILNQIHLKNLMVASLLHDIGKLIDYKTHVESGFRLLKDAGKLQIMETATMVQHHENIDGTGYPNHLKGSNILITSQILAVSDKFTKLCEKELVHDAVNKILDFEGSRYSREVLFEFKNNIYSYPVGLQVLLSNGEVALVLRQNKGLVTRPLVCTTNGKMVDLKDNNDIKINGHILI